MNPDSNLFWIVMFGGVLLVSLAVTAFGRWCMHGPAVPYERLNRLRVGMTMQQVRELLGEPHREAVHTNLPEWRYSHRLKSHLLIIRFDEDGNVRQFRHVNGYDPKRADIP